MYFRNVWRSAVSLACHVITGDMIWTHLYRPTYTKFLFNSSNLWSTYEFFALLINHHSNICIKCPRWFWQNNVCEVIYFNNIEVYNISWMYIFPYARYYVFHIFLWCTFSRDWISPQYYPTFQNIHLCGCTSWNNLFSFCECV